MATQRRSVIKKLLGTVAAITTLGFTGNARSLLEEEETTGEITDLQDQPLYSSFVRHGNVIYLSGIGAHVAPFEIKAHTEIVLKEMEKTLIKAGSSMKKVLKVSVFLDDIADYKAMNEVYKGRFVKKPPVRTTVAVAKGGVPGDSLVEMDCIAYI
ncbi:MAG TPA: RidA family protein [Hanamia sp.]|nr:RidA family protein [Hanamia sp.]